MFSPEQLEKGRLLFAQPCEFVHGTDSLTRMPDSKLAEIAFAGRSNVGKSSLVNALTGRHSLARASNTPGRTRQLNFFQLGQGLMLVDLPGYGYAKAPKKDIEAWTKLVHDYLRGRAKLRRVCMMIDGRHGIKDSDVEAMSLLDESAVTYMLVLTKGDKVKPTELAERKLGMEASLKKRPAAYPQVFVTSSVDGTGMAELRAELAAFA